MIKYDFRQIAMPCKNKKDFKKKLSKLFNLWCNLMPRKDIINSMHYLWHDKRIDIRISCLDWKKHKKTIAFHLRNYVKKVKFRKFKLDKKEYGGQTCINLLYESLQYTSHLSLMYHKFNDEITLTNKGFLSKCIHYFFNQNGILNLEEIEFFSGRIYSELNEWRIGKEK